MNRLLFLVDEISTWVGKTSGWCILILTFTTSYEVFSRYMFRAPTEWAFDASYILYGTLFMMAGAYALVAQRSCARRFYLPRLGAAYTGEMGPCALFSVFLSRHVGVCLRRIRLRRAFLAYERALLGEPLRADRVALQMADPDRRRTDGDAGRRRSHPLRPCASAPANGRSGCTTSRSSTRSFSRRPSTANTQVAKSSRNRPA